MDLVKFHCQLFRSYVNNSLASKEPFQIVTVTATTVLTAVWFYEFVFEGNEGGCTEVVFIQKIYVMI